MKKLLSLCLFAIFLLTLGGCNITPLPETSSVRHEYNSNDPNKNLFLQFLHDEIPVTNYGEDNKALFFSDIDSAKIEKEDKRFFIVDMDGDGKPELCYLYPAMLDIVRYNEETECFELWLSEGQHQRPLGEGQMWEHTSLMSAFVDSYFLYDEHANLLKSISYGMGAKDLDTNYYQIDGVDVTEGEWRTASAWLLKLIENAPEPLSLNELYEI